MEWGDAYCVRTCCTPPQTTYPSRSGYLVHNVIGIVGSINIVNDSYIECDFGLVVYSVVLFNLRVEVSYDRDPTVDMSEYEKYSSIGFDI